MIESLVIAHLVGAFFFRTNYMRGSECNISSYVVSLFVYVLPYFFITWVNLNAVLFASVLYLAIRVSNAMYIFVSYAYARYKGDVWSMYSFYPLFPWVHVFLEGVVLVSLIYVWTMWPYYMG